MEFSLIYRHSIDSNNQIGNAKCIRERRGSRNTHPASGAGRRGRLEEHGEGGAAPRWAGRDAWSTRQERHAGRGKLRRRATPCRAAAASGEEPTRSPVTVAAAEGNRKGVRLKNVSALEPVMASQVVSADRFLAVGLKSNGLIGDEGIRHGQLRRGCVPRRRWPQNRPLSPSPPRAGVLGC
jgi:hypothetical protein